MLNSIIKTTTTLFTLALVAGITFFALKRVDRYLDIRAIQDCTSSYRQEITDETTGVTKQRPLEQQARECAMQKGVKNWDGIWSDLVTK